VHAIAYSDKNELKGRYVETSRQNFLSTLNISCYSFTDVAAARLRADAGRWRARHADHTVAHPASCPTTM
jgi:hypothetical protein